MITEEIRAMRRTGIGGSDIGAIMGLSNFRTAYDVFLEKMGNEQPREESEALFWGNMHEDLIAKVYAQRTGHKVQRVNQMMRHPEYDFVIGNIDRAVINPDIQKNVRWKDGRLTTDRILECKTAHGMTAKMWGEPGTDYIPDAYMAQVQWYMLLTGCKYADLAVLIGSSDFRIFNIERDDALITHMVFFARTFWENLKKGIPPTPQSVEEAQSAYRDVTKDKSVELNDGFISLLERLEELRQEKESIAAEEDKIKARIMTEMQDAEEARHNGRIVCTWKNTVSNRFDSKAFKEAEPDLYKQYTKQTASRRFLLKGL